MPNKKKIFILLPDLISRSKELEVFGRELYDDFEVYLIASVFFKDYKEFKLEYELCLSKRIKYDYYQSISFRILNKFFKNYSFWQFIHGLIKLFLLRELYNSSIRIINKHQPDAVLCLNDRGDGITQPFLKASKEENIKVIIPYFTVHDINYNRRLSRNFTLNKKSSFFEKYYFEAFKNLLYNNKGNLISFYQVFDLFAYNKFRTLSKNPWWNGNNFADVICVDNNITKDDFIKLGNVDPKKINIIGGIIFDELFKKFKIKKQTKYTISEKYSLIKGKPIIVIALPQYYEEGDFNLSLDDSIKEIDFLLDSVTKKYENVLVSLHPKMKLRNYKKVFIKYRFKLLDEKLQDVISVADIFIASNSSTIFWAVLMGIKNICICFMGLSDLSHKNYKSIKIVKTHEDFLKLLKNIENLNFNFEADWKKMTKKNIFDGNTIKRYKNLITNI